MRQDAHLKKRDKHGEEVKVLGPIWFEGDTNFYKKFSWWIAAHNVWMDKQKIREKCSHTFFASARPSKERCLHCDILRSDVDGELIFKFKRG